MNEYILIFQNFVNIIELNFYLSLIIFFIVIFFYCVLSLPGLLVLIVFSGYIFGVFWGYVISLSAATLGSLLFFIISKFILSKFFHKYYSKYTQKIDKYIKNSSFEYLIIFRMIPGNPLLIQNLILSTLNINYFKFIFSTLIGFTPFFLFSVIIGNKLGNIESINKIKFSDILTWDLLIVLLLSILLLSIRIIFKKK